MYQNSRLPKGNQITCIKSLGIVIHLYDFGNGSSSKFPDSTQWPTLPADLPKDSSPRACYVNSLVPSVYWGNHQTIANKSVIRKCGGKLCEMSSFNLISHHVPTTLNFLIGCSLPEQSCPRRFNFLITW